MASKRKGKDPTSTSKVNCRALLSRHTVQNYDYKKTAAGRRRSPLAASYYVRSTVLEGEEC